MRRTPSKVVVSPYSISFGRDAIEEGMSLPVGKEAEDAIELEKKTEKVEARVKNMLEQEHKAAEARQSKGGKPTVAGIDR